jgi:hypothetical protein
MKAKARNCKALPGYQHRLLAATPELATLRGISHCMIKHDDGCGSFQRHPCTCVPHISVVNGDNLLLIGRSRSASYRQSLSTWEWQACGSHRS